MTKEPNILDLTEGEDVPTIKFPDGQTCEMPTPDSLSLSALQYLAANGEEWFELWEHKELSAKQQTRYDHLSDRFVRALLREDVPKETIDALRSKHKARIIVGFTTASPDLRRLIEEAKKDPRTKATRAA